MNSPPQRKRFSANLSRSSIYFLLQLVSFHNSFDLLSSLKSFFSYPSRNNLPTSLTKSQTLYCRRIFFCFTCPSSCNFLFNCFSVAFFSFEVSSWKCSYLNRALLTDFYISVVMVILLSVTFLDDRWLWLILKETRQFSDCFNLTHTNISI